jgi:uncharacterized membrane protein YphA (DoxX/SURF4 family)
MVSRGFSVFLAFLRIAAGLSLIGPGLRKLGWFTHPTLEPTLAAWAAHPHNALVAKYLALVTPHHGVFARLVVLGELGLGALLVLGFLTPLAALLAFAMVLNYHFASGQMFALDYLRGQSGLVYLLIFPVLLLGRAGTSLGLDGVLARSGQKPRPGQ